MIFAIPDAAELPPVLAEKRARGVTVAYLCEGMTCSAPLTDLESIVRELKLRRSAAPGAASVPAPDGA